MLRTPPASSPYKFSFSGPNFKREPVVVVERSDGKKQTMTLKEAKELGLEVKDDQNKLTLSKLWETFVSFLGNFLS